MHKNIQWLQKHAPILKIYAIENELNMPEGTLKKFIDGNRGLPINWHQIVIKWVSDFKK